MSGNGKHSVKHITRRFKQKPAEIAQMTTLLGKKTLEILHNATLCILIRELGIRDAHSNRNVI